MEVPESVRALVEQLGEAVMAAMGEHEQVRALAAAIQAHGFEVALLAEVSVILKSRDGDASEPGLRLPLKPPAPPAPHPDDPGWSEEDRAFLQHFKIRLD